MLIQVIEQNELPSGSKSFVLSTEKKHLYCFIGSSFTNVLVNPASNPGLHRNGGKVFHGENTLQQALEAYKSGDVKAMLQHIIEQVQPPLKLFTGESGVLESATKS